MTTKQSITVPKANNLYSPNGSKVANQFEITTDEGVFFQSYETIIAFRPYGNTKIILDHKALDYSPTTSKYLAIFLGESSVKKVRDNIKADAYAFYDFADPN
jgi:hypothetical protein